MGIRLATALVSVIALAILASAVAMWYDILKIHAEVKTGSVDVEFTGNPRVFEGEEYGKPWVASCSATLKEHVNEDEGNPSGDNDLELVITVSNAYPCYYCKVSDVNVKNTGTVPVKLAVEVKADGRTCVRKIDRWGQYYYECDADGDGDLDLVLWGCFTSLEGVQLEPGGTISFTVDMHVEQGASEGATYEVQILIKAIQWNEYK
ncbi:MAG: hypothetical protein QXG82_03965 [Sulfolobales archaeon]